MAEEVYDVASRMTGEVREQRPSECRRWSAGSVHRCRALGLRATRQDLRFPAGPSVRGLLRRTAASGSSFVRFQPFPRARRAEIGDVAARSDVMPSPAVVLGSVVEDTAALRILA